MLSLKVSRLGPGAGEKWRTAVDALVPPEDRSDELISVAEAEYSLADARCYLLVAEVEEEVKGLLSAFRLPDVEAGGTLVYLYDIEVAVQSRQQGIGKQMVEHLIELCGKDDVCIFELSCRC